MNRNSKIMLKKGTLWKNIIQTTHRALSKGVQLPIPTHYEFIEDGGICFLVRIVSSLKRKDEDRLKQLPSSAAYKTGNPFLPYDKNLFVAEISETHIALLNKFNVVENHLLIVTRHFEDQETLLTLQDFRALWACMAEYRALGFYNGGVEAGASQRHKHLQMVPLPLASEGSEVPIEPLFDKVEYKDNCLGIIPEFSFLHVFARLKKDLIASTSYAAENTFELYASMLAYLGLETPSGNVLKMQSLPYCFLIDREWMLLVPRAREYFDSISINSLGYAGAFLVRDREQMNILKKHGPMEALKSVAIVTEKL